MLTGNITTKMEANEVTKARAQRKLPESGCQAPAGPSPRQPAAAEAGHPPPHLTENHSSTPQRLFGLFQCTKAA